MNESAKFSIFTGLTVVQAPC